ncbi:hypothetical protein ACETIH_22880 [Microvirga arabica]|uniref:Uncharacterized protein n=1 Tax=Microvirga arabica TaxID=1128671 RepID=A0ABV6YDX0_9HYPH
MSEQWLYQLRLYLADELAEAARRDAGAPVLGPLPQILEKHNATMKCQLDAFSDYVAQAEADGVEGYPLYEWTKATICLVAERCWDRVRWAIENYTWRFDGTRRPPQAWWRI